MPLTSMPPTALAPPPRPPRPTRTSRWRRSAARLATGLVAATLAATVPVAAVSAGAETPPVAPIRADATDCAPAGFPRPAGAIPPGYIYSPTSFSGTVQEPQPDDTFASTSPGHAAFAGRLRTRMANNREELLVCAHVGTNTPDDALTPFATDTGPAHPATIAPRVQIIDAVGGTTTYGLDTPGLTDAALAHYAGSTDPHEAVLQLWIPFMPTMAAPGFTVRAEVRGTSALAGGGTGLVTGADEAYVHLGGAPVARNAVVDQAAGLALDDSAIAERPSDPGADDLASVLKPLLPPLLADAVAAQAPSDIADSWDWSPGVAIGTKASGRLDSLSFTGGLQSLDVVDFNANESRLQLHITGTMFPKLTLKPRAVGFVSIVSGSCAVTAQVSVSLDLGVTLDIDPTGTRPTVHVSVLSTSATTSNVTADGTLFALYTVIPGPMDCYEIHDDIQSGLAKKMEERLHGMEQNAAVQQQIADKINVSSPLDLADLAHGPIANLGASARFGIAGGRYVPTAPAGHAGGQILVWHEGVDVAASMAVTDLGGTRFPFSYRPAATSSVVAATHTRTRPTGYTNPYTGTVSTTGTVKAAPVSPPPPTTLPTTTATTVPTRATTAPIASAPSTKTATQPTVTSATRTAGVTGPLATASTGSISAPAITGTAATGTASTGTASTGTASTGTSGTASTGTASGATAVTGIGGLNRIDPGTLVLNPGTPPVTDFDLGLIVNGATVNQLSRALTAGTADGTGLLDIDFDVAADAQGNGASHVRIRPSVPPLYLPTAPAGWPLNGPVRFLAPSLLVTRTSVPFSVSADVAVGADAQIDVTTNHLVPLGGSGVAVRLRFLHLDPSINTLPEPTALSLQATLDQVAQTVPDTVARILQGVEIPDLSTFLANSGQPGMVISHLTLATVGGGHLGVFLNVDPNPAKVTSSTTWTAALDAKPTKFTVTINPQGFPGSGGYNVVWTVRDANSGAVTYQSPAAGESVLTKTFNASLLGAHLEDSCTGERTMAVKVTARVSRNNVTNSGTATSTSPEWYGTANTHLCAPDTP